MDGAQLAKFLTGGGRRIHLIGVAGSGMSGIAGLCLALGHRVSGSDKATQARTHLTRVLDYIDGAGFYDANGAEVRFA